MGSRLARFGLANGRALCYVPNSCSAGRFTCAATTVSRIHRTVRHGLHGGKCRTGTASFAMRAPLVVGAARKLCVGVRRTTLMSCSTVLLGISSGRFGFSTRLAPSGLKGGKCLRLPLRAP